jgi:hypothetical protein
MYILNLINNSKDIVGFSTCSKKFDTYQRDLEYVDVCLKQLIPFQIK